MADLTGFDPANLQSEPLRSALTVELPAPQPNEPLLAVPPPAAVASIDQLLSHDRLSAAFQADTELASITGELERRPGNPGIVERLIAVLGAWASTRRALGLDLEARLAVGRALAWTLEDSCSNIYAFTVQRAVGILASPDDVVRVEHALAVHMLTSGGADAVVACLIQLADLNEARGHFRRARCNAEAALGLAAGASPRQLFHAESRLVHLLLTEGRTDEADRLLGAIDASTFPLPVRHAWLNAHAAVAEASGDEQEAWSFQLLALELATEVCGTESMLEDLLNAHRLRVRLPGSLKSQDEDRLIESIRKLARIVGEGADWIASIRNLSRGLISGEPTDRREPEILRDRLSRLHRNNVLRRSSAPVQSLPHHRARHAV